MIYDINGKNVKTLTLNGSREINIQDLPAGMYTLRVSDEENWSRNDLSKNNFYVSIKEKPQK